MSGDTERSQKSLGKVSNAGSSFAGRSRKPEVERPLSPTHVRVELAGHVVFLEGSAAGWTAITEYGVFINPWKERPFSTKESAIHAVKRRLQKGKWPGKLGRRLAKESTFSRRPEVTAGVP